eukprot:Protomagalhaensia_wolfi_Nauph_80__6328@NODE_986_length_1828_cov_265_116266_g744_i0_p2_GENE_NODE_986_length_1828_cov_265_116266_g744_i0NODE_986_length_1828_cov_265_116266_g744_i0_p2_ORF_typecomplete_len167_score48_58Skp1/PF01466_19/2_1e03Skp1/PF01466_19/1_1e24Skp1_POZ/PF03931_15/1_2e13DUF3342/PF11822_8/0_022BetaCasp/PF10996_8/0_1_NODE_986_length_1828_cov_265_116266_g744_i0109609
MVVAETAEKATVTLKSKDDKKFEISREAARLSGTLSSIMAKGDPNSDIPVSVDSPVLEKIIEYLNNYKNRSPEDIPKPLPASPLAELIPEWDAKYIAMEQTMIFELILGANYLDIPGLLDLCCAKVASEIRNKSVDEIRKVFGIENDFTPEEEAQIREENKWCEPE